MVGQSVSRWPAILKRGKKKEFYGPVGPFRLLGLGLASSELKSTLGLVWASVIQNTDATLRLQIRSVSMRFYQSFMDIKYTNVAPY